MFRYEWNQTPDAGSIHYASYRRRRRPETGTTTKAASQNKPQATNAAPGNVKTVLPDSKPSSVADRHQVTVTPIKVNLSGGENRPPANNSNTAGVKLSQPTTTSPSRQENKITKTAVAIPEGKTQALSSHAIGVKAVSDSAMVPRTELIAIDADASFTNRAKVHANSTP